MLKLVGFLRLFWHLLTTVHSSAMWKFIYKQNQNIPEYLIITGPVGMILVFVRLRIWLMFTTARYLKKKFFICVGRSSWHYKKARALIIVFVTKSPFGEKAFSRTKDLYFVTNRWWCVTYHTDDTVLLYWVKIRDV